MKAKENIALDLCYAMHYDVLMYDVLMHNHVR